MNYDLLFSGLSVNPKLRDFLKSITINDRVGLNSDTARIVFAYDAVLPDFKIGQVFEVKLGLDAQVWSVGKYYVNEESVTGPGGDVLITGMSSPFIFEKSLRNSHKRAWQRDSILSDILRAVASDAGLLLEYSAETDFRTGYISQTSETDAELLQRIGKLYNLNFKVSGHKLIVFDLDAGVDTQKQKIPDVTIAYGDVLSFSWRRGEGETYKSASALLTDVKSDKQTRIEVGSGEPRLNLSEVFGTIEEARAACESKLAETKRKAFGGDLSLVGRAGITAGGYVVLSGFPRDCDGRYHIQAVNHQFSVSAGYKIAIAFESVVDF